MISDYNNLATTTVDTNKLGDLGKSLGLNNAANSVKSVSSSLGNILGSAAGSASAKLSSALSFGKELGIGAPKIKTVNINKKLPKPKKPRSARGGLIPTIINIVKMTLKLPTRFNNIFQAFQNSLMGLVLGIEGISKSFALGVYDIMTVLYNIFRAALKYINCIISFIITLPFCAAIHIISLFFYLVYLPFPIIGMLVYMATGFNLTPYIDYVFEMIDYGDDLFAEWNGLGIHLTKWPPLINRICYTCFGKKVKMRDVVGDISIIGRAGRKTGRDFSVVMPQYMRRSTPYLKRAIRNIEKVFKK
jgi:hypothetical protein